MAQQTFSLQVKPHVPSLMAQARRLSRCGDEASDLVQETLLRGWRNWHKFEQGTNLRAWLQRVLFRVFLTHYRSKKRRSAAYERLGRERERSSSMEKRDPFLRVQLENAIQTLSPSHANVVSEIDLKGGSYADAATELQCPIGTVMSRLARARKLLREQLGEEWAMTASV